MKNELELIPRPQKRTVKGMLVNSKSQLAYALGFVAISFVGMISTVGILIQSLHSSLSILIDSGRLDADSAQLIQTSIYIGIAGMVVSALGLIIYASWVGFRLSHRVYGPVVPIVRQIKQINEGNFKNRIHLRKRDELREIADALNELAQTLETKQKFDKS